MKGIVVKGEKGSPVLVWEDVADVVCGAGEVLVAVGATAVNRADLSQARGNYPPPPGASEILGLEMAGTIEAVGEGVSGWRVGDRVCALLPGGGYAQKVVVPAGMLMSVPGDWTLAQAAAIPEVWFTAYVNLFLEGDLQPGERVLIHAGGSGVGTAAVQLAHHIGAEAYVTAGAALKLERCRQLGAALAVNYKEEDFLEAVLAFTNHEGVDVVLDPVGAAYLDRNMQVLRRYGRLVNIGLLSGAKTEMNMGLLIGKRLKLIGSTLRTRPLAEKVEITRQFSERFWPKLIAGELQPIVDTVFPIEQAQAAHEYVAEDKNIGKVILAVGSQ
ncbi:MAG: NAD(P)H-quinone oxidoreductase [Ardenticatenaceae bacterium]|nr:NAD(P)H-quinone oxidoreductase [Ardenticatenaceae bacterium]